MTGFIKFLEFVWKNIFSFTPLMDHMRDRNKTKELLSSRTRLRNESISKVSFGSAALSSSMSEDSSLSANASCCLDKVDEDNKSNQDHSNNGDQSIKRKRIDTRNWMKSDLVLRRARKRSRSYFLSRRSSLSIINNTEDNTFEIRSKKSAKRIATDGNLTECSWLREDVDILSDTFGTKNSNFRLNKERPSKFNMKSNTCTRKHQVAIIVGTAGIDLEMSYYPLFLQCLDAATAAIYNRSAKVLRNFDSGSNEKHLDHHPKYVRVESFCSFMSMPYEHKSTFIDTQPASSLSFHSPESTILEIRENLMKLNFDQNKKTKKASFDATRIPDTIKYPHTQITKEGDNNKAFFEQLSATIFHLCNSLPWNTDLADKSQHYPYTKSIYVLLPLSNLNPKHSSNPVSSLFSDAMSSFWKKHIHKIKLHLKEQPAGGIKLFFVPLHQYMHCNSHLPIASAYHRYSSDFMDLKDIYPRWKIHDLYRFLSQYSIFFDISSNFATSISQCNTKTKLKVTASSNALNSPTNAINSSTNENEYTSNITILHLDFDESKNACNIPPSLISCVCIEFNFTGTKSDDEVLSSDQNLIPSQLQNPYILPNSILKDWVSKVFSSKSFFLLKNDSDDNLEMITKQFSLEDIDHHVRHSELHNKISFLSLILSLRINCCSILFQLENHEDHSKSSNFDVNKLQQEKLRRYFLLTPLSPSVAIMKEITIKKAYAIKNQMQKLTSQSVPSTVHTLLSSFNSCSFLHSYPFFTANKCNENANMLQLLSVMNLELDHQEDFHDKRVQTNLTISDEKFLSSKQISKTKNKEVENVSKDSKVEQNSLHIPKKDRIEDANLCSQIAAPINELLPSSSQLFCNSYPFKSLYDSCVESNNPTPIELVLDKLFVIGNQCKKENLKLFLPAANLVNTTNNNDNDLKEQNLRVIQIQILLRMQFLVVSGVYFLDFIENDENVSKNKINGSRLCK